MIKGYWFDLPFDQIGEFYKDFQTDALKKGGKDAARSLQALDVGMAFLAERDLFYLFTEVLNRKDATHPWLFERCREYQNAPDDHLDLWAREHYKSSVITFAGSIADIIADQETTIGIFSHTRPLAKQFLRQIKFEMESNAKLPRLWPGIFWQDPKNQSPKWSEDDGIVVIRKNNPKESTVEAWGLVDGQPTSKHFKKRKYDDIVTEGSVSTPDQIDKTTKAWELSNNLGAEGGSVCYAGTRYHLFDTYRAMIDRGSAKPRVHPATANGEEDGEPVLMSRPTLAKKRRDQGPYTFAAQMLLNPTADKAMGFKEEWLKYLIVSQTKAMQRLNRYIIVDPASGKNIKQRKDPDFTTMWVVGAGSDKNFYVLDGLRDRLNLSGRTRVLMALHRKWRPKAVGYEEYGMQADIEHIEYVQDEELYKFAITPLGGQISKADRIKKLIPEFEAGRIFLPNGIIYTDYTGSNIDIVKTFVNQEYLAFPVLSHDDQFDGLARILDEGLGIIFPDPDVPVEGQGLDYSSVEENQGANDWLLG